jgi:circadian clock protein KaiB
VISHIVLRLYVTGRDHVTDRAAEVLRSHCETIVPTDVDMEVIDILESPEVAEANRILATPTLIKELPPPVRRVIGDISDVDRVAKFLGIAHGGRVTSQGEQAK